MPDLTTREVLITRADADRREIIGMAVPFNTPTEIFPGLSEQFERGSITCDDQPPKLFFQHDTPIGTITALEDRDDGAWITAHVSATRAGDEALTLVRDGVLDRLSVAFMPVTETTTTDPDTRAELITRTKVILREVSIVNFPAYPDAKITATRNQHNPEELMPDPVDLVDPTPDTLTRAGLDGMATRADLDELARQLATLATGPQDHAVPDTRNAAEVLKAVASGDTETRALFDKFATRAYTGGTTADDARGEPPAFIADLTRIIDNANPLANLFGTAALPAEGMTIEFSRLASDTTTVAKQAAEGDPLASGKVSVETDRAPIETFGGWSQLSVQEVQRTRTNMLQLTLNAMAVKAGIAKANAFAGFYENTVKGQAARALSTTITADALKWGDLVAIISDATDAFTDLGVPISGLIVGRTTWVALASLTGSDNRPLMKIGDGAANVIGTIAPASLSGDLSGITVIKNTRQTTAAGAAGAFFNADALRTYTSGVASLSDQDIVGLTRSFSVFQFLAFADEQPTHLLPLKLGDKAAA
ncbi:HK97 family phage prohead protease [Propionibacterium freudenreichii]|uniref:HK97 family phage prohead protease n=1 Tax=Propionibacterium freudenreichii TaxID=1744 RepID=UPI00254BACFE|nr:HK97 family phage prohead protease [Propionibacterium freudenreichii]MDK9657910.1 HK97 family phage prohead protease [Propionibacterium freudenreichii]